MGSKPLVALEFSSIQSRFCTLRIFGSHDLTLCNLWCGVVWNESDVFVVSTLIRIQEPQRPAKPSDRTLMRAIPDLELKLVDAELSDSAENASNKRLV